MFKQQTNNQGQKKMKCRPQSDRIISIITIKPPVVTTILGKFCYLPKKGISLLFLIVAKLVDMTFEIPPELVGSQNLFLQDIIIIPSAC